MINKIKKLYVIHHSHTDIGYTDLQERVIDSQRNYIRTVLDIMRREEESEFRWNCETFFCVEKFFEIATREEKKFFYELAADGKIGLSATYLNFTDLLDSEVYGFRLKSWRDELEANGVVLKTAMVADINGISMGQRDVMIDNGVEFLYMNIHCHHGMYPLYQNQTPFFWERKDGKRLLVWNGEHYNLGNVLGLKPNKTMNFMQQNYMGQSDYTEDPVEKLYRNLTEYLLSCEKQGYCYNFIISSVSGVFSDNAPPSLEILYMIRKFNERYGEEVEICMVSLDELYALVKENLKDIPVYRGDMTDWWAGGVGSTPYAVKHYKEACHKYHLCSRLDSQVRELYSCELSVLEDNLLLYAEHTWGHSSTITNPYDTMVLNLDMRKNSYASKAHEAASQILNKISEKQGDILRYYNTDGKIRVCSVAETKELQLVEFYIETMKLEDVRVISRDGSEMVCQVSAHPRGKKISFLDTFKKGEEKIYEYSEAAAIPEKMNTRRCYMGSERVRDIVNSYDNITYKIPYYYENKFFRIEYDIREGIKSFVNRKTGQDMLKKQSVPIFMPVYEVTHVRRDGKEAGCPEERERRLLGRNIRGQNARLHVGTLEEVICEERGKVFTVLRFRYSLPGTIHADVVVKIFEEIPRIDFKLEIGKTISTDIESIYMPLGISLDRGSVYMRKGTEIFRPGVDQLPGTCMEFYISDDGLAYISEKGGVLIASKDAPLFYAGEMKAHPIRLCENNEKDNDRPLYSWVMNNLWETNFKMDLSGFGEYEYSLWLCDETDPEKAMDELREYTFDPYVLIVE